MSDNKASYEALLAQIRDNYFSELPEKFAEMESLALEMIQGGDNEVFESLFRSTHSMKGSAGTYGLDVFTTICHNLEDCFYEYKEEAEYYSADKMRDWLAYIDLLRRAYALLEDKNTDFSAIDSELENLRNKRKNFQYRGLIIAESDLDISVVLKTFAIYGVDFSQVHDGMEGLERLLNERFDFYICNNQLPRLNGISIIAAIKQSPGLNRDAISVLVSSVNHKRHGRTSDPDHLVIKDSRLIKSLQAMSAVLIDSLRSR
ncbi:MAG: Hpt domain-containing protein [Gammaproteobacteria bacterium]|nr:Hpt domain-containing protein [Gammaproteobacteria bacterium]